MQTIKEYNQKLARLRTARKITRTMKLIAVNRMRQAQEARHRAAIYGANLNRIISVLARGGGLAREPHALCKAPANASPHSLIVLISADRGLCGGFNSSLFRTIQGWLDRRISETGSAEIVTLGRRGALYGRNHGWTMRDLGIATSRPEFRDALRVGDELQTAFLAGGYREIFLGFNQLEPPLHVRPSVQLWLPFQLDEPQGVKNDAPEFIVEPERGELIDTVLHRAANFKLYLAMLNSAAGEHTLRMMAMDAATSNADELIENTTMVRNRLRHAAITRELLEIVGGAEALRN